MNDILETSTAFWRSAVLFYAMRMNLFERLGEKPSSAEEIAVECKAETVFTGRILRALAAMKMVVREGETYRCSEEILNGIIPGRESNLSHFVRLMSEDFSSGMWAKAPEMPSNRGPIPAIVEEKPAGEGLFTMAMQNLSLQGEAKALADAVDTSGCRMALDLGCGSGIYTVALCRRNPELSGVLVDLPEITGITRKIVAEYDLEERIQVVPGDWNDFKANGNFDIVLLSDVIYHGEADNLKLLKTALAALKEGGKVVIRGYFLDEGDERIFPALFDINLMVSNPGHFTPSVKQVEEWLTETGFSEIEAKPLTEMSYLMTAVKPAPQNKK